MNAVVTLEDLTVSYRRHPALHHICGSFEKGSLTAVLGNNGAGKSTLLKSILGLLPRDGGRIDVVPPRTRIAYLPQQSDIDRGFPISVLDCVLLGDWSRCGLFRRIVPDVVTRAQEAVATVGLAGFENRSISTLSAGQFQRVLFARILLQDADLILLDEPFNAIDERTTAALMDVVRIWHSEQRTVIAVLHDFEQVRRHFPQALLLARRAVAWGDTAEVLLPENLHRARTMTEAWDEVAPVCSVARAA